jgi:hypothetical protein
MMYLRASVEVYEQARVLVDGLRGLPKNGQTTSFSPASEAPHDTFGRVYLVLRESDFVETGLQSLLSDLVESGQVQSVSEQEYFDSVSGGSI